MADAARTLRFRGTHAFGISYAEGDIVVRGRWAFDCTADHVSGSQSEPNFGEHWGKFWRPTDGFVIPGAGNVLAFPPAPAPSPSQPQQHPARQPSAPDAAPSAPALRQPYTLDNLPPALIPRAQDIALEGEGMLPNVSMELDWLRKMVSQTVRREWVDGELAKLKALIARLVERIGEGAAPALPESEIAAECWRRKAAVLGAPDRATAEAMVHAMTREQVRLLRKRDRGEVWSAEDAARDAVLDTIDRHLVELDRAAARLEELCPPDAVSARHWPQIGGPA